MTISLFQAYFVGFFVTIATVKFKYMSKFYTSVIHLINQSKEIGEKQFLVFGSRGGKISPLMRIPLSAQKHPTINAC